MRNINLINFVEIKFKQNKQILNLNFVKKTLQNIKMEKIKKIKYVYLNLFVCRML